MSNIVTFEQAERLSILGFDKYTTSAYFKMKQIGMANEIPFGAIIKDTYQAPTVSEALDYLREEKGIECACHLQWDGDKVQYKLLWYDIEEDDFIGKSEPLYPTHPLASSALLTAVLDYLEKKGGDHEKL